MTDQKLQQLLNEVEIARDRLERYRRGRKWITIGFLFAVFLAFGGLTLGTVTAGMGINLQTGPGFMIFFGVVGTIGSVIAFYTWRDDNGERTQKHFGASGTQYTTVSAEERLDRAQAAYRSYLTQESSEVNS